MTAAQLISDAHYSTMQLGSCSTRSIVPGAVIKRAGALHYMLVIAILRKRSALYENGDRVFEVDCFMHCINPEGEAWYADIRVYTGVWMEHKWSVMC